MLNVSIPIGKLLHFHFQGFFLRLSSVYSYELVFEVNLAPSVNKMLSNCDDIIRQHKAACLRVTSLLACKDLIWVGTSAGVLLTISGQNVYKTGSAPQVTGKSTNLVL
jgi:Rho guanine nucleotide exchange factor 17